VWRNHDGEARYRVRRNPLSPAGVVTRMHRAGRVSLMSILATGALLLAGHVPIDRMQHAVAVEPSGHVLAPIGRQAGWLSLAAPRRQVLTSLPDPAYVADVAAIPSASFAVIAVSSPFAHKRTAGDDLLRLDTSTGTVSTLLERANAQESVTAPAWWPDSSGVLFERDDLNAQLPVYAGESTPRFTSRIESLALDGSQPALLIPNGRMPTPSPDGSSIAFVQTTSAAAA
jgi:hypothetical protein